MEHLVSSTKEETLVKDQFNIPVVNVIWRMVASKTFPLKSEEGLKITISQKEDPYINTTTIPRLKVYRFDGRVVHKHTFPPRPLSFLWQTSRQEPNQKKVL